MTAADIIETGRRALRVGLKASDNPFKIGTQARSLWADGYREARALSRSPTSLSPHERAVLAKAAEQVRQACERPWIAAMERVEIEDAPCKNDRFTAVEDDGSCLRCGADQGEMCR